MRKLLFLLPVLPAIVFAEDPEWIPINPPPMVPASVQSAPQIAFFDNLWMSSGFDTVDRFSTRPPSGLVVIVH